MTTPNQILKQLTTLTLLTTLTRTRLPPTLQHLAQELSDHDGYPSIASGSDTGSGGQRTIPVKHNDNNLRDNRGKPINEIDYVPASSVETAALNRIDHTGTIAKGASEALYELAEYMRTAIDAINVVLRECDNHTHIHRSDIERLRCIGTGEAEGATCTQIAVPRRHNDRTIDDNRCLDCGRTWDNLNEQRRKEADERRIRRHRKGHAA